ncbi:nuclear pore complex protein Nup153-like [Cylas formicarius]|uniref:nuclear pore complex protein Nup153-like n=1 Tax=Cylas formicarius TaxID=197179 RepID=UPI0029586A12|nr:nuclear pore complex protein Nup153-like [Cylas formicarius]
MIRNNNRQSKCLACESPKPESIAKAGSSVSHDTWECHICLIRNKDQVDKCASCAAIRPDADAVKSLPFNDGLKKSDDEWVCEVCTLRNESTAERCDCCESLKSGTRTSSFSFGVDQPPPLNFTFGLLPSQQSSDTAITSPAVFGVKPVVTDTPPTFTFGLQPPAGNPPGSLVFGGNRDVTKLSTDSAEGKNSEIFPPTGVRAPPPPASGGVLFGRPVSPIPAQLSFGEKFRPAPDTWECPTCMIRNNNHLSKCLACESPKPESIPKATSSGSGSQFTPPPGTWECQICLIKNEDQVDKCVACAVVRPDADGAKSSSFGDGVEKSDEEWECEACTLRNESTAKRCVCCESLKPGAKTPPSGFSFGRLPSQEMSETATDSSPISGVNPEVTEPPTTARAPPPPAAGGILFARPAPTFHPPMPVIIPSRPRHFGIPPPLNRPSIQVKEPIRVPSLPTFNFAPTKTRPMSTAHENETYTDKPKCPAFNFRLASASTMRTIEPPRCSSQYFGFGRNTFGFSQPDVHNRNQPIQLFGNPQPSIPAFGQMNYTAVPFGSTRSTIQQQPSVFRQTNRLGLTTEANNANTSFNVIGGSGVASFSK